MYYIYCYFAPLASSVTFKLKHNFLFVIFLKQISKFLFVFITCYQRILKRIISRNSYKASHVEGMDWVRYSNIPCEISFHFKRNLNFSSIYGDIFRTRYTYLITLLSGKFAGPFYRFPLYLISISHCRFMRMNSGL